MKPIARAAAVMAVASLALGCRIGETTYETMTYPVRVASETRTCEGAFATPDIATLEACEDGKGHCYDDTKVPLPGLPRCQGGEVYVPDKLLEGSGTKMKACTFGDSPGACTSLLVGPIGENKNQLPSDGCDADTERCAPCVDPRNGESSHLCDPIGVYENACKGGSGADEEVCCHGAGICLSPDGVPADSRGDLAHESCSEQKLCAPAAMVDNNPVKCDVLGFDGVCIDLCFASMLKGAKPVLGGGCRATEVCMPCLIGKGQGMPGCE